MTACLTLVTFLGTSAAQTIAAEDATKQQSPVILQAICQPDGTFQQQFKEDVTTLGNKSPKKLGKRGISESTAEHGTQLFCLWYNIMHGMYGRKNCSFSLSLFIAFLVVVYLIVLLIMR